MCVGPPYVSLICRVLPHAVPYRGTSLKRNSTLLGSCSGTMPRSLWWPGPRGEGRGVRNAGIMSCALTGVPRSSGAAHTARTTGRLYIGLL